MPYGATRSGAVPTGYQFTAQRNDGGTELYYYGARYYDPVVGRFISADTIVPSPGNPQALNRYAYVYNSPIRYSDPTGHYEFEESPEDPDSRPPTWYYAAAIRCAAACPRPEPVIEPIYRALSETGLIGRYIGRWAAWRNPTVIPLPPSELTPVGYVPAGQLIFLNGSLVAADAWDPKDRPGNLANVAHELLHAMQNEIWGSTIPWYGLDREAQAYIVQDLVLLDALSPAAETAIRDAHSRVRVMGGASDAAYQAIREKAFFYGMPYFVAQYLGRAFGGAASSFQDDPILTGYIDWMSRRGRGQER